MSELHPHSFDAPRQRSAPLELWGHDLVGRPWSASLRELTLVIAVKPHCDGCLLFVESDLKAFSSLSVVLLSATAPQDDEWRRAPQSVYVAPDSLAQLDVTSPPWYLLIDPSVGRVVLEGVPFSPEQVSSEIASSLPR